MSRSISLFSIRLILRAASTFLAITVGSFAQDSEEEGGGSYSRLEGGGYVNEDTVRTARETASHSTSLPDWTNPAGFKNDVFTFARLIFKSTAPRPKDGLQRGPRLGWYVDYPDADLNLSYRLQQMTSMVVDPDARVLKITNPDLFDFPLVFMEHVEDIQLSDREVGLLRQYLNSGGTLMALDFWGVAAWEHFSQVMKEVLPERSWVELTIEHPLFQAIFPLKGPMYNLRVPTLQFWNRNVDLNDPKADISIRYRGEGSETMHVWAMLDDKERILVLAIHNSDISDGWEREGENEDYFKVFSEARSYPFAINAIVYLMTH